MRMCYSLVKYRIRDLNMKPTIEINEENFEIEVLKLTPQLPCPLKSRIIKIFV